MSSSRLAAARTEHMSTTKKKKTWNTKSHKMFRGVFLVIISLRKGNVDVQDGKWSSAVANVVATSSPQTTQKFTQTLQQMHVKVLMMPFADAVFDLKKIRFPQLQLKAENLNGITLMTSLPILDRQRLSAHICCRACWESCASNLYISEVLRSCTYLLRHLLTCLQVVVLLLFLFFFSSWVAVATDLLVSVPARSTGRRCE